MHGPYGERLNAMSPLPQPSPAEPEPRPDPPVPEPLPEPRPDPPPTDPIPPPEPFERHPRIADGSNTRIISLSIEADGYSVKESEEDVR